jgi:hypothetical protein
MGAGGPAMPSPGDPQAEPTIGKAINGGFDLLEAKCNRCDRVSLVPLRTLRQSPETQVWKLEAALYCQPCSEGRHHSRRQRAHILGLTYVRPDPGNGAKPAGAPLRANRNAPMAMQNRSKDELEEIALKRIRTRPGCRGVSAIAHLGRRRRIGF